MLLLARANEWVEGLFPAVLEGGDPALDVGWLSVVTSLGVIAVAALVVGSVTWSYVRKAPASLLAMRE